MKKSLIQKIKEHGKYEGFNHKYGFIYSMNDCIYSLSKNGVTKL